MENSELIDGNHLNIDLVKDHQGFVVNAENPMQNAALGAPADIALGCSGMPPINDNEGAGQFFALPDSGYRNRAMTFQHFPPESLQYEFIN